MAKYVLTDDAKEDIRSIVGYIRRDDPRAAYRVRFELRHAMKRLADFPLLGHRRTDLTDLPVRFWNVYSYLIVYIPDAKPLQVIRVLHAARDVKAVLTQER